MLRKLKITASWREKKASALKLRKNCCFALCYALRLWPLLEQTQSTPGWGKKEKKISTTTKKDACIMYQKQKRRWNKANKKLRSISNQASSPGRNKAASFVLSDQNCFFSAFFRFLFLLYLTSFEWKNSAAISSSGLRETDLNNTGENGREGGKYRSWGVLVLYFGVGRSWKVAWQLGWWIISFMLRKC